MNTNGYPLDLFAWTWKRNTNANALILSNHPFSDAIDLGNPNFTAWEASTRSYLTNHPECNVIMWAWCSQLGYGTEADVNTYLNLMDGLQQDFTNVTFVYMTGPLYGTGANGNLNARNNQIRNHCKTNGEVLFDFADIESYDPNGLTNYMELFADDNCDYDSDGDGSRDRNWAIDWQNSHIEGIDWFACYGGHTQPLNFNLKAYAAWWLWARLAGWPGPPYTFEQWLQDNFTAEERANQDLEVSLWGRWADPDADGLPNIFEYALGQQPRAAGCAGLHLQTLAPGSGSGPVLTYQRARNTQGVSFSLQSCQDLILWADVSPESVTNRVEGITDGLERVEIRFVVPPPETNCFYRLSLKTN